MATRARIAIENADGTYTSAYQHWDGYPGGLGYKLVEHWENPEMVREAIELGDASSWGTHIGTKVDFDARDTHGSQNIYYTRDRGEDCPCQQNDTLADLLDTGCWEEYVYVLAQDGKWYYAHAGDSKLQPLALDAYSARAETLRAFVQHRREQDAA